MESSDADTMIEERKRSFWLSAFLIIMFITNPLTAFSYFSYPEALMQTYPILSINLMYFMGVLAILNTLFVVAIWSWKKIGVYGIYFTISIAFMINLYIGVDLFGSIMGLAGVLIIFVTTRKNWSHFH